MLAVSTAVTKLSSYVSKKTGELDAAKSAATKAINEYKTGSEDNVIKFVEKYFAAAITYQIEKVRDNKLDKQNASAQAARDYLHNLFTMINTIIININKLQIPTLKKLEHIFNVIDIVLLAIKPAKIPTIIEFLQEISKAARKIAIDKSLLMSYEHELELTGPAAAEIGEGPLKDLRSAITNFNMKILHIPVNEAKQKLIAAIDQYKPGKEDNVIKLLSDYLLAIIKYQGEKDNLGVLFVALNAIVSSINKIKEINGIKKLEYIYGLIKIVLDEFSGPANVLREMFDALTKIVKNKGLLEFHGTGKTVIILDREGAIRKFLPSFEMAITNFNNAENKPVAPKHVKSVSSVPAAVAVDANVPASPPLLSQRLTM